MNRILRRANVRLSLGSAAFLLASSSLMGIILGIFRTKLINANFNNFTTGSYFVAFKIPDFIFFTLAAGAMSVAFMPVLSDKLSHGNRQDAWVLASYVINMLSIVMFILSVILILFPVPIIQLMTDSAKFTPEQVQISAQIMRLVAVNPLLFSIGSVLSSVQQASGRFFFYAIAPIFYNLSIIISIYVFRESLGIVGVGVGVVIGAILSLLVVAMGMNGLNFRHHLNINFKNKSFRQVMFALPQRSADQGIVYLNSIIQTRYATGISVNAVANFENALLLYNAPVTLIGLAISTAAFPRFNARISQGRPDLFRKEFLSVLKAMVWITIPVVATSYFARDYFARIIFARDNREIALIFGFLCIGIFFRTIYSIVSRYFYAQKDTKTPLVVTMLVLAFNVYLSYVLSRPDAYGVSGLAIAASIVAVLQVAVLMLIMAVREPKLFNKEFLFSLTNIASVAAFVFIGAFIFSNLFPLQAADQGIVIVLKLGLIGGLTVVTHILVSALFGVEEAAPVTDRVKKFVLKPIRIQ